MAEGIAAFMAEEVVLEGEPAGVREAVALYEAAMLHYAPAERRSHPTASVVSTTSTNTSLASR